MPISAAWRQPSWLATVNTQQQSARFAQISVKRAVTSVRSMELATAKRVQERATAALKNAEKWPRLDLDQADARSSAVRN